jgi:ABC-type transport system involved in cytochrome bd biosynthesis fused ATPase/permease subunit
LYEKIFRKVILEHLKHKTRIIATNDINALKDYENIVLLKEGQIKVSGDMQDLVGSEDYLEFISNANNIKIVDEKKVRDVLDLYVNIEDADC